MIAAIRAFTDRLMGRGSASVTVPVFDGALKANHRLDEAAEWCALEAPGDMVAHEGKLYASDGARLLELSLLAPGQGTEIARASGAITAIAPFAGGFGVAVEGRRVEVLGGTHGGEVWTQAAGKPMVCVTALAVQGDHLIATDASATHGTEKWQYDLMQRGSGGRVLRLTPGADAEVLASGLGYGFGVVPAGGDLWVSESWRHRVVALGSGSPVIDNMPGYPSRLTPAQGGGYWLSVFACRTQLVEFVLREDDFREEMMRTMPPNLWVAPQVTPPSSFLEPLQGGAIKQMGVLKPWAPPRSYGLIIRLSPEGRALYSLHSRVDGCHHGISAVAEVGDALFALALGAGAVLRLGLEEAEA